MTCFTRNGFKIDTDAKKYWGGGVWERVENKWVIMTVKINCDALTSYVNHL